jgi:Uma2 family endonuclease
MEANRSRTRWTWAEFARLPSEGGLRHEVVDGELVVTPAPGRHHQRIVSVLLTRMLTFTEEHRLGEVYVGPFDVIFGEGDYLEPDILFVRSDRTHLLSDRGVEGPPDLVVEVTSPSTAGRDRGAKLDRYRHHGVGEYWIVDPDADTVEVWRLAEGATEPEVSGRTDVLRWTPVPDGPTLSLGVSEVVRAP